uniref:Uncharacterized protein n=1 Tax=Anguilla anguilla TaxID=7936 RepID=A0A0E9WY73_ANGAN
MTYWERMSPNNDQVNIKCVPTLFLLNHFHLPPLVQLFNSIHLYRLLPLIRLFKSMQLLVFIASIGPLISFDTQVSMPHKHYSNPFLEFTA